MSSNEPVKNGCEVIYEMFHILNCGFEIRNISYITSVLFIHCKKKINGQVYQYRRIVMYRKKY